MTLKIPKKPIIVKNSDFQTIIVRVMFPFYEEEDCLTKLTILPNLLMYMNNKYPSEDEFQKSRKKNYILNTGCSKITIGTTMFLCFNMMIPDTEALGFDNLESQFEFFQEMIYNPKIVDGGFDKFELEREKKNIGMSIDNAMKNLKPYQAVKGLELIDDEGILSRSIENHRYQLEDITHSNMYELYKKVISCYHPAVFVFGNVDDKRINTLINKYIYRNLSSVMNIEKRYNYFLYPRDNNIKYVEEKKEFKDSSISLYYKIKNMSEKDFAKLSLVRNLLSSLSSRLLNKKLRDENDLVYSSNVLSYSRFGVFEITAYINKNNKDLVIEKIKEVMEDIKSPEKIELMLQNIKERRRISLIKSLDDKFALLNDAVLETLEIDKNMRDSYMELLDISANDISEFVNRFVLDTVYFIEEA